MPKGIDRIRRRVRVGVLASARGSKAAEEPADSTSTAASSVANIGDSIYEPEELEEYRLLFQMFDTDGSGAIGNDELKEAILSFGHQASDAEIDELIQEVDEDGNGEIDFGEFCHCLRRSQQMKLASNEEFIRQCFSVFDQDKNGIITRNEFTYIATEIGGFTEELSESIFGELDVCSNGYLSADQFAAICDDYMLNDQSRVDSWIMAARCFALVLLLLVATSDVHALRDILCYCQNDPSVCPHGRTVEHCSGSCVIVLQGSRPPYYAKQLGCTAVVRGDTDVDRLADLTYRYCNENHCNVPSASTPTRMPIV
ncbi:EF hand [Aphelenchoides fujianensis]|nr:EF hand [Aphelenchoides fujianensis]